MWHLCSVVKAFAEFLDNALDMQRMTGYDFLALF
jgi:hypothetical protein